MSVQVDQLRALQRVKVGMRVMHFRPLKGGGFRHGTVISLDAKTPKWCEVRWDGKLVVKAWVMIKCLYASIAADR